MPSKRKGRIAIAAEQVANREQAEMVLGEHARLSADLEIILAELADKIVDLNAQYEGRIETLKERIKSKTKLLNTWADANPDEFAQKKSISLIYGRLGYRTTPPSVKAIKGKLEALTSAIQAAMPTWIRQTPEIDKEQILADYREARCTDADLAKHGIKVVQRETFFVEPKLEIDSQPAKETTS